MAKIYNDRWEVIKSIGEGGQAHVLLVRDVTNPDAPAMALKRLKNHNRMERFRKEFDALQKLDHPNILKPVDHFLGGDRPFIVMPYCDGLSLADHRDKWERRPVEALDLTIPVARALAHAHENGVVHRDVKPSNILLRGDPPVPVLSDFGICLILDNERVTLTDEAVGARFFTAPELEEGRAEAVTPAADIYSLGKVLYYILAGGKVFPREQYREGRWNFVSNGWPDAEHLYWRLFDHMITAQPGGRFAKTDLAVKELEAVRLLYAKNAIALFPGRSYECVFCHQGQYISQPLDSESRIQAFGLTPGMRADWEALVCDMCGHVQLFRTVTAKMRGRFWGRSST